MTECIRETMLLLRVQACRFAGVNSLAHGHDRRQRRRALGMLGICLLLAAMAVCYSLMLAWMLAELGAAELIPRIFALAVSMLALVAVMFKGPEMLFGGSDVRWLRSVPVATRSIVLGRLIGVLVPELAVALLIGVPAGVIYGLHMGAACGARLTLALCLLPAIPTALALALGTLLAALTMRLRHRAFIIAVLNIVLLVAVMAGGFAVSFAAQRGLLTQSVLMILMGRFDQLFAGIYPPADWAAQTAQGAVGAWLLLLSTALAALALTGAAATAGFARIADALSAGAPAARGKAIIGRPRAPLWALYAKEWARFTSSSIYMMNASAGWLLYLLAVAAICLADVGPYLALLDAVPAVQKNLSAMLTLAVMLVTGMSSTTSCSISMEGRQMEMMRSLPARTRDWLGAKLLLHMTLAGPVIVLGGVALSVRLGLSLGGGALLVLAPLAYALAMGAVGLALNLRFPRLDWEREVEAVKNGLAVLLTILIGMIVPIAALALILLR